MLFFCASLALRCSFSASRSLSDSLCCRACVSDDASGVFSLPTCWGSEKPPWTSSSPVVAGRPEGVVRFSFRVGRPRERSFSVQRSYAAVFSQLRPPLCSCLLVTPFLLCQLFGWVSPFSWGDSQRCFVGPWLLLVPRQSIVSRCLSSCGVHSGSRRDRPVVEVSPASFFRRGSC